MTNAAPAPAGKAAITVITNSAGARILVFLGAAAIGAAWLSLGQFSDWERFGINLVVALAAIALSFPLSRQELRVTLRRRDDACTLQLDDQPEHVIPTRDGRIELLVDAISLTVRVFRGDEERGTGFASRPTNQELERMRDWLMRESGVPARVSKR